MYINVIGAGLAGCEAAMQIAKRGVKVRLYEMKPLKKSPAHHSDYFGELVCSNSLKNKRSVSKIMRFLPFNLSQYSFVI